jgi:hypothetical protein
MTSLVLVGTSQMFVVDTSMSTRHIHQLILVRFCAGKKLIVQSLEVFCEVVRFARGDRDFLK